MLSDFVKQARKERKMSQEDLGHALFVSKQAVGKWERGEALPSPEMIVKIAKYFDISVDELLATGNTASNRQSPANPEIDEAGLDEELIRLLCQLEERDVVRVQDFVRGLIAAREAPASHQD